MPVYLAEPRSGRGREASALIGGTSQSDNGLRRFRVNPKP